MLWKGKEAMLMAWDSPLSYYLTAATGCGFEQGRVADIHFGAKEYVGENHKVRIPG
jgi:hypothetical protein